MRAFIFILLVPLLFNCKTNHQKPIIAIQPFDFNDKSLIDSIKSTLQKTYQFEIITLQNKPIPQTAFINKKSPRYRADSLLKILKRNKPDSIDYVIGLINNDISCTKKDNNGNIKKPIYKYEDWGVFGLGYLNGPSCVVSTHRIKNKNKSLFLSRFQKVCVHEIGHNLGLSHCINEKCVMNDAAETIKTVDKVNLSLCNECKQKIN